MSGHKIETENVTVEITEEEYQRLELFMPDWRSYPDKALERVEFERGQIAKVSGAPLRFPWEMDLDKITPSLIERCIPAAGVGCLYARSGIGKSAVALDLAFRVACGAETWANQRINTHGDVVYVAMEGGASLKSFIRGWKREHPQDFEGARVAFFVSSDEEKELAPLVRKVKDQGVEMYMHEGIGQLEDWVQKKGLSPKLIILDTQVDMMDPGVSENESAPAAQMYRVAQQLGVKLGCFVLFLHHSVKTPNRTDKPTLRGSSGFEAKADMVAYLRGVKSGRGDGVLVWEKRKDFGGEDPRVPYRGLRDQYGEDLCVTWDPATTAEVAEAYDEDRAVEEKWARTIKAAHRILVGAAGGPLGAADMSYAKVKNALKELATRKKDPVDVYYGGAVDKLLNFLNGTGVIYNAELSLTNGNPAKWNAGPAPDDDRAIALASEYLVSQSVTP